MDETRDEGQGTTTPDAGNITPVRAATPQPQEIPELDVPEADPRMQATYDVVLARTRVYNRVRDRDVDAITSVSTTRSRPWSVLSGVSMANISIIAVISLPLHEPEMRRFRQLMSPINHVGLDVEFDNRSDDDFAESNGLSPSYLLPRSTREFPREYPHLTEDFLRYYGLFWNSSGTPTAHSLRRINKELNRMAHDPPSMCNAQPIGDDLVCLFAQVPCVFKLTNISITGKQR
ncbi:hypothetical protein OEA41_001478 [Lepraria neglecta]|uniref:Uncharacterized protein n=1 Tax=Lepraria neglecta TaxID=209136 RepID=A0AAD9ZA47_9LECA|nr:hypothetical protein OEA41_001478 [Lepraria neglecta]